MEHFHEWLNLLLRWIHFIVGVAWIGASFYFNWLENNLDRRAREGKKSAGELWAIHGGGFYHLEKYQTAPSSLQPKVLHWFKWEAYATWLSGFALLVTVYYFNANTFLFSPDNSYISLTQPAGIAIGITAVIGAWFFYDALCRSPLRHTPALLAAAIIAGLVLLAWMLSGVFSGRAAYIHIGAAIGTIMVGNVFFVIIPVQKKMVTAMTVPDSNFDSAASGQQGLLRSRHNNYLTLPVLFIMISAHFPFAYGHAWNWAVLAGVSFAGWLARHYFNVRRKQPGAAVLLPAAFVVLAALAWFTLPPANNASAKLTTEQIMPIIQARCTGCHAESPTQAGFTVAPLGLTLQSPAAVERHAAQIYTATVTAKTMPIANLTGMTGAERAQIAAWYDAFRNER